MDSEFGFVIVFIFLSDMVLLTSSIGKSVGHFRVLRKHPQLRKCAEENLSHTEYVGVRTSEKTGVCEGLSHSWGRNQTIENGYGYMTKMNMDLTFNPPAALSVPSNEAWTATIIPGIFSKGARIDFHITGTIEDSNNKLDFMLNDGIGGPLQLVIR
ncbi:uncharacterized protein LOC123542994 [Mercenaria mercenaria]|uniref:uncharacterized protein LOC123542994 n=1 Tax=Mercenaria mercenaria TaxID=6596 RepID=UPI00234F51F5|nr:uncharacterized protein LOC123542994 [Mercenaria mercenaria]